MARYLFWLLLSVVAITQMGCNEAADSKSTLTLEDGTVLMNVPVWYLSLPDNEDTLYARGTSAAVDMITARTVATNKVLQSIEEQFGYARREIEILPKGAMQEKFILVREKERVRAYVLMKIPFDKLP